MSLRDTTIRFDIIVNSNSLSDADRRMDLTIRNTQRLGNQVEATAKKYEKFGKKFSATVTAPIVGMLTAATKSSLEFNHELQGMRALLDDGHTSAKELTSQLNQLGAKSKDWAVQYGESTSNINTGMEELIKKGYTYNQTLGAMPSILDGARASGDDFNTVMSISTSVLEQFGLKVDSTKGTLKNTQRVVDSLAYVANATAAGFSDMGLAMEYVGPMAHAVGYSLEDTASAIGLLSNNGVEGEKAGTALRGMLASLLSPSKQAAGALNALGVDTQKLKQHMYTMPELLDTINTNTKGMSDAQKNAYMVQAFGREQVSAMNILLHQGGDALRNLSKETQNATGYTHKLSEQMGETPQAKVKKFVQSLKVLGLELADNLIPVITPAIEKTTELIKTFSDLPTGTKKNIVQFGLLAAAVGPVLLISTKLYKGFSKLSGLMSGSGSSFGRYRNQINLTNLSLEEMIRRLTEINNLQNRNGGNGGGGNNGGNDGGNGGGNGGNGGGPDRNRNDNTNRRGFFRRMGRGLRGMGKIVPIAGTLLSATQLIGMNSDNAGDRLGGFGGSLAGGGVGAAIGSAILPGIGTAVGGAIGAFAGSSFGEKFGTSIQKAWPTIVKNIDHFNEKNPILSKALSFNPFGTLLLHGNDAAKAIKKFFKDPLPAVEDLGNGVSKSTAKAVNAYKSLNDKASVQLKYLAASGDKFSKSASDKLAKNFNDMTKLVEDRLAKSAKDTKSNLQKLVSSSVLDSSEMKDIVSQHNHVLTNEKAQVEKTNKAIQKANTNMYKESKKITDKYEKEINDIKSRAKKKGLTLTEEDINKINGLERLATEERKKVQIKYKNQIEKLQAQQSQNAVKILSKSAKEQKLILGKLQDDSGKISAKQAADIVKQSVKARDGAVKEANKKYKEVMAAANEEYYVNGSISKAQYEEIKANATKQRDAAVSLAKEMNKKVVEQAKKQAAGHLKEVDWETGQSLSKWNQFEIGLSKFVNGITGGINKVLKFLHIPTIPEWHPAGSTGANLTGVDYSSSRIKASGTASMVAYASGTTYHPGGKSLVGEEGPELAYIPYKGASIVGQNGAEIVDLPRGAKVLPHYQTKQLLSGGLSGTMPGYASGTVGALKDFSSWLLHPVQQTEKLFSRYLPFKNDIGPGKGLGTEILSYLKDGVGNYLKDSFKNFIGLGAKGSGSKQLQAWLLEAIGTTGISPGYLGALTQIAMHESGGNPKAINLWDSNAKAGHPSKGLMQTIDSTFNRYALPGHTDIWNPVDNAIASIRYSIARYGSIANVPGIKSLANGGKYRGYKTGGRKFGSSQVLVGEEGPELVDLPDGSHIQNVNKTQDLLKHKGGEITFNFSPVINIEIKSGTDDTTEAKIQRAVNKALEQAFKDLRGIFNTGVAY